MCDFGKGLCERPEGRKNSETHSRCVGIVGTSFCILSTASIEYRMYELELMFFFCLFVLLLSKKCKALMKDYVRDQKVEKIVRHVIDVLVLSAVLSVFCLLLA